MGSNLVIVAIPEEQDRVWKISSEKVPHLTLLFLGDADSNPHVQTITEFVQHAVDISEHGQFYLDVDRRDVLGPDEADVVFFSKRSWNLKWITQFRNQLLQQDAIRTAYDSTTQYPEWQPHLTLGYPTAPAKELDGAFDHPIYSVCFDRIAVWTGDYEGPEFRLEWPERMSDGLAVAYSSMNEARAKAGLAAIEHVGVKGMKWGVRKTKDTAVATASGKTKQVTAKKAAKLDKKFVKNTHSFNTFIAIHNKAAEATNAHDIERINNKPEYKNKDFTKPSPLRDKYYKEHADAFNKRLAEAATSMKSPTGKKQYDVHIQNDGSWSVVAKDIQHAAGGPTSFVVKITYDADGYITKIEPQDSTDSLTQTAIYGETFVDGFLSNETLTDADLAHHGIKGMRWGVRNRREAPHAVAPAATSHVPHGDKNKTKIQAEGGQNHPAHEDAIKVAKARVKLSKSGPSALSNQELRDVATRIQLEQQVKQLTMSSGKKFAKRLLGQQGNQFANQAANKAGQAAAKRAAATAVLL